MANRISTQDVLGGGTGVKDLQISVRGFTVDLPFSHVNGSLQALGAVL